MKKAVAILLLAVCASIACAQGPQDVPRDHWAYDAISELMNEGYVTGFPDGTFQGNRSLTRYELATIVKRILDGMNDRIAAAERAAATKPSGPTEKPQTPNAPSVSREDLAKVQKLIEEFKPELVVIGTRIDKLESELAELKSSSESVNAIVMDPEGAFESMKSDVSKLKKVSVSGYVQARYNTFQGDLNKPAASSKPPSSFSVRRARIKVAGRPTTNSLAVIQLDGGQNYAGTSAPSVSVKDAYLEYDFAGDANLGASMLMGQMKWPFGYEVVQSSSVRESPERSLIVQRLFPGERDRGFYVSWPFQNGKYVWKIGAFNGVQTSQTPPTSAKAGVTTFRATFGDLDLGASAWFGKVIEDSAGKIYYGNNDPKTRYGVDAEYYLNDLSIKAEYIVGVGCDGADSSKAFSSAVLYDRVDGGWAQIAWNFLKVNTLAVKYETLSKDPLYPTYGRRSAWDLGLLRWLDDKTRVKLYYIINQEENNSFNNNAYIAEWITLF